MAQYYQFLRLGRPGYTKLMRNMHAVTRYLSGKITELGGRLPSLPAPFSQ